jgi:hypothetical protein
MIENPEQQVAAEELSQQIEERFPINTYPVEDFRSGAIAVMIPALLPAVVYAIDSTCVQISGQPFLQNLVNQYAGSLAGFIYKFHTSLTASATALSVAGLTYIVHDRGANHGDFQNLNFRKYLQGFGLPLVAWGLYCNYSANQNFHASLLPPDQIAALH